MTKVVVYEPDYDDKHRTVLRALARGIPGAVVKTLQEFEPGEADVAVVFGWFKYAYQPTMAKKPIIEYKGHRLLVVESAFQRRGDYYQIGWDGFAGFADFNNEGVPDDRWRAMGIETRPWQRRPDGPVVVFGQLPRDTQVQDTDHVAWCQTTMLHYLRVNERVYFRPHPRQKDPEEVYGVPKRVWAPWKKLPEVLSHARVAVTWNSTTGVDAAIAGVPVVTCDKGAMAWPIAAHGLDAPPRYPSRRSWLAGIGYAQWTLKEMMEGAPWRHLTRTY